MDTLLQRISEIVTTEKITIGALEKRIGASKGVLSRALQNGTDIQAKWVSKIVENYPQYSSRWLLTGYGTKFKSSCEDTIPITAKEFSLSTDHKVSSQDIPLYDLSASAGLVSIFNDLHQNPEDYLRVPNLPPVDGAVYVRGDSMSPLLKSGDIIIFKKMELSLESILWGQIYLLSFDAGGDTFTVVKYVHKADKQDYLRLVSHNVHYEPKDIPVSSIRALAIVKASLTFHTME